MNEIFSPVAIPTAIPLDSYHLCPASIAQASVIAQISLSLAFGKRSVTLPNGAPFLGLNHPVPLDVAVFVFVLARVRLVKSMHPGVDVPSILNTVSRDAKVYFAVISSSHTLIVIMYSVARVRFFTDARI